MKLKPDGEVDFPYHGTCLGAVLVAEVAWHHKAESLNVKMHVYKCLDSDVNVWELVQRDGETIPNGLHPYRCLLMYCNGQPRMNRSVEVVPMELPMSFDSSESKD